MVATGQQENGLHGSLIDRASEVSLKIILKFITVLEVKNERLQTAVLWRSFSDPDAGALMFLLIQKLT